MSDLYIDQLFEYHKILKPPNGFTSINYLKNVKELSVSGEISQYDLTNDSIESINQVKNSLVHKLAESLISNELVEFEQCKNIENYSDVITASINIVEPGKKFVNLTDNKFIVQNEEFSNDELVQAVKIAYPERFI